MTPLTLALVAPHAALWGWYPWGVSASANRAREHMRLTRLPVLGRHETRRH
jgi:hypothetical protein